MDIETLTASEISLSGNKKEFENIGVEVPLRYYAFENQGKIIQRRDNNKDQNKRRHGKHI